MRKRIDSLSLIGGEFFNGQLNTPEIRAEFFRLTDQIIALMKEDRVGRSMICASLMYENPDDWHEYLDRYESAGLSSRLLVCTSWDTWGRFDYSPATRLLWERNVLELHRRLPDAMLHVEMILTQDLINRVLDGRISIKNFEDAWACRVDFNTPYLPFYSHYPDKAAFDKDHQGFFPKRRDFFRFLQYCHENGEGHLDSMLSCKNHSTVLHYTLDDKIWIILPERHSIGHTCTNLQNCQNNCCGYLDSPIRMHDDVRKFLENIVN